MKRVALFAAHFPPSNLAAVHRSRLWAQYLHEFGWQPTIVTTHWRYYEEALDWRLCKLVDPELAVIRTRAIPAKPVRLVGDIGIRGFPWHLSELTRLLRENAIDFLHITVPSFYSAILGEALFRKKPIPFGIDYIDPWVHVWPEAEQVLSKAWASMMLSRALEPWAVRNASLITGIAEGYYAGVLDRNPHLQAQAVTAAMPYGSSSRDYELIPAESRRTYLFNPDDGAFHMLYAGAMLPRAYEVLDSLLGALVHIRKTHPEVFSRLRIHFVGTGRSPNDSAGYNILPRAERLGLNGIVTEWPARVPYTDILFHLTRASAILILGSTEPHYSPSKVYQSVQARRPIFALLHKDSTACRVVEKSRAGVVVNVDELSLSSPTLAERLISFVLDSGYQPERVVWSEFDAYSSRESARKLALALDEGMDRFDKSFADRGVNL
jgi:hypothetical protein